MKFFQSVSHVMMKLTSWIVCLAPVGVAFLIAGEILHMKSVLGKFIVHKLCEGEYILYSGESRDLTADSGVTCKKFLEVKII